MMPLREWSVPVRCPSDVRPMPSDARPMSVRCSAWSVRVGLVEARANLRVGVFVYALLLSTYLHLSTSILTSTQEAFIYHLS